MQRQRDHGSVSKEVGGVKRRKRAERRSSRQRQGQDSGACAALRPGNWFQEISSSTFTLHSCKVRTNFLRADSIIAGQDAHRMLLLPSSVTISRCRLALFTRFLLPRKGRCTRLTGLAQTRRPQPLLARPRGASPRRKTNLSLAGRFPFARQCTVLGSRSWTL